MSIVKLKHKERYRKIYVVGDIHGCFSVLDEELKTIGFDKSKDLLIGVGDLVDRGPESEKVVDWLKEPWFMSVKGNHDQMAVDGLLHGEKSIHIYNGGLWLYGLPSDQQQEIVSYLDGLPDFIEIETEKGPIVIVHAEIPFQDWNMIKSDPSVMKEIGVAQAARWSRRRYHGGWDYDVAGAYKVICGHTVVNNIETLGNVMYIDTGAVFKGVDLGDGVFNGRLTIVDIDSFL